MVHDLAQNSRTCDSDARIRAFHTVLRVFDPLIRSGAKVTSKKIYFWQNFGKRPFLHGEKNSRGQVNVRTRCSLHIPGRKSCLSLGEFTFHRCPASRKIPLEQVYPRFHDIKVFFALSKAWLESFCQLSRG